MREMAILTADMENFSSQMRMDESSVITLLLNTYYRRAQEAVDRHGGRLFRREGDAIWCSFSTAQAGLDAGLWLLAKLAAYNRGQPESAQIRLRVGLAWGEVNLEGDVPSGPPLAEARQWESAARVGCLRLSTKLLETVQLATAPEIDGESALVQPPASMLEETVRRWILALDLSAVSSKEVQNWLTWAISAIQRQRAQVYEGHDRQYVVVWSGDPPLRDLPFVLTSQARATLSHRPITDDISSDAEPVLNMLDSVPLCPGLWSDAPLTKFDTKDEGLWYRGSAPVQALELRDPTPPETPDQELGHLAQALAEQRAGWILTGPWFDTPPAEPPETIWEQPGCVDLAAVPNASLSSLRQFRAPIYSWYPDPRLGEQLCLIPASEQAWAEFSDDPLLRRGELVWICPPGSAEWLKLLYADYDFRFQNRRPGLLLHPGWDEREERRWRRRGFEWQKLSPDFFQHLAEHYRFYCQVRSERRRLSPLPSRPYKFLNYYTREDRMIFFGRDSEVERLRERLFSSWVLVVFGKSGVGKTSLLRAGLLCQFQAPQDLILTLRMLSDPVSSLRSLLTRTLGLEPDHQSLAELLALAEARVTGRVILVLDQFEEFFLRCSSQQRTQFGRELAAIGAQDLRRTHLVLSLREDFLAQMSELEPFVPTILKQRFRVSPLEREQAQAAVLQPARLFGVEFDERVVDDLLEVLDEGGIEPPQMQIVLDRLYEMRSNRRIGWDLYEQLGGAEKLLEGYFEEALQQLGPETRRARQLLKRMITTRRTKLVVTQEELEASLGWPSENIAAVLKRLVESRLVRSWQEDEEGCYELAHDFLVQEIARWETPEEVAIKHAQAVLRNELRNYTKLGMVVPGDRLRLLEREAPHLTIAALEQAMLLRSAILRGLDPSVWMSGESSVDVLLGILDERVNLNVTRSVIRYLCALPLSDTALARTLQAVREAGNPHLLEQLAEVPERLREPLAAAVRERFFGPEAMVFVQGGPAWLGSTEQNKRDRKARLRADLHERIDSEADFAQVEVEGFFMDRLLVTNEQYTEFRPVHQHFFPPEEARLPAVNVSYEEALEYAAWLGKALPSETQWEKAARGTDGRLYPWGNEWDPARCNCAEAGLRTLLPVDSYPQSVSPYGCVGMAGNVWEWTCTPWEPDSPLMAKKGGCALNFEPLMQCSARFEDPPEMRLRWAGFRLVSQH